MRWAAIRMPLKVHPPRAFGSDAWCQVQCHTPQADFVNAPSWIHSPGRGSLTEATRCVLGQALVKGGLLLIGFLAPGVQHGPHTERQEERL